MTKLLLLASVAFLAAAPAKAATFTVSDAFGTGSFGTATAVDLGATTGSTDTVKVTIDMSPNFILDTGSHWPLTFSLTGTGRIDASTLNTLNPGDATGTFTAKRMRRQLPTRTRLLAISPMPLMALAVMDHRPVAAAQPWCLTFSTSKASPQQPVSLALLRRASSPLLTSSKWLHWRWLHWRGWTDCSAGSHSVQLDADPRSCLAVCQRCCWSRRTCSSQAETKTVRSLAPSIRHRRRGRCATLRAPRPVPLYRRAKQGSNEARTLPKLD